jgi:hypothetical protein
MRHGNAVALLLAGLVAACLILTAIPADAQGRPQQIGNFEVLHEIVDGEDRSSATLHARIGQGALIWMCVGERMTVSIAFSEHTHSDEVRASLHFVDGPRTSVRLRRIADDVDLFGFPEWYRPDFTRTVLEAHQLALTLPGERDLLFLLQGAARAFDTLSCTRSTLAPPSGGARP